jgi:hypothetical protein
MWLECAVCGRETAGIVVVPGSAASTRHKQINVTVASTRAAQAAA